MAKVYVQWALRNPRDWQLLDSAEWVNQPTKAFVSGGTVTGGATLNNAAGWVAAINCQGIEFADGDHFAMQDVQASYQGRPVETAVRVTFWYDDPNTTVADDRRAIEWTLFGLSPDARVGGELNTRQVRVVYAAPNHYAWWDALGPMENHTLQPWTAFTVPPAAATRHGILLSDAEWGAHVAVRTTRGWREWAT